MNTKSLLMVASLCLSTAFAVNAKNAGVKTYAVLFSEPTTVGKIVLPKGDYKLKLDGANLTFVLVDGSKTVTTTVVKIDNGAKKAEQTLVMTDKSSDGTLRIHEIDLGGSTMKLVFTE
jgi:hypothetical protein